MKLFDSYKAICNDYDFQFSIKNTVFYYLWITNLSKISSYYTLGQTHMDFWDQIYYFWALANGFEKYMFPGDYICSKNIQKMYHALIHTFHNFLKKLRKWKQATIRKYFSTF